MGLKNIVDKFATGKAKEIVLRDFEKPIRKACQEKRITFNGEMATYKFKGTGEASTMTIDELADFIFNKNLTNEYIIQALMVAGVTSLDVKDILIKIRDGGKASK